MVISKRVSRTFMYILFCYISNGAWDCCLYTHNGLPKPRGKYMATVLTLFMNLWRHIRMDAYTRTLRFNHNPLNLILGAEKKKGLRIGYMEAGLQGFYLNSMETGIHPQKLSKLLTEEFHCTDNESATGLFQFLINEGDRVSYQIMLPYLLSTENINEFENIIQKRFSEWNALSVKERIYTNL